MNKPIIYTINKCIFCDKAKELFNQFGVEYTEFNVSECKELIREMALKRRSTGFKGSEGMPVIIINDEVIVGYIQNEIQKALLKYKKMEVKE